MGMSSYVMDIEEKFIDKCADVAIGRFHVRI